jgi:hypothetical protein
MTLAPQTLYKTSSELLPELRTLCNEHSLLTRYGPETVRHTYRTLRRAEVDVFAVERALEALRVESEVLG